MGPSQSTYALSPEYVAAAIRTECDYKQYEAVLNGTTPAAANLLHLMKFTVGLGETVDKWKKLTMYGKQYIDAYEDNGCRITPEQLERLNDRRVRRLIHSMLGLFTESVEIAEILSEYIEHGGTLDGNHVAEELGDQFWYLALALDELVVHSGSIAKANIAKLRARYPDKFTAVEALNRNLDAERNVLDGTLGKED